MDRIKIHRAWKKMEIGNYPTNGSYIIAFIPDGEKKKLPVKYLGLDESEVPKFSANGETFSGEVTHWSYMPAELPEHPPE